MYMLIYEHWASPIMLLFTCDYAIFYAPIMPLYAHIYAPNYADYAQIMQIMPKYAVYATYTSYTLFWVVA